MLILWVPLPDTSSTLCSLVWAWEDHLYRLHQWALSSLLLESSQRGEPTGNQTGRGLESLWLVAQAKGFPWAKISLPVRWWPFHHVGSLACLASSVLRSTGLPHCYFAHSIANTSPHRGFLWYLILSMQFSVETYWYLIIHNIKFQED